MGLHITHPPYAFLANTAQNVPIGQPWSKLEPKSKAINPKYLLFKERGLQDKLYFLKSGWFFIWEYRNLMIYVRL